MSKRRKDTKGRRRAFGEDSLTETAEIPKARIEVRRTKKFLEGKARPIQWRPYKRLPSNTFLYLRLTPEVEDEIRRFCNNQYVWRDGLLERLSMEVSAWLIGKVEKLHYFGRYSDADSTAVRLAAPGAANGDQPAPAPGSEEAPLAPSPAEDPPAGAADGPDVQPVPDGTPREVVVNGRNYTIVTPEGPNEFGEYPWQILDPKEES